MLPHDRGILFVSDQKSTLTAWQIANVASGYAGPKANVQCEHSNWGYISEYHQRTPAQICAKLQQILSS